MKTRSCVSTVCIALLFHFQPIHGFGLNLVSQGSVIAPAKGRTTKEMLLQELDDPNSFNAASKRRTELVKALTLENPTPSPGSSKVFSLYAEGTWRVVYAPHIYTMGNLIGGKFYPVEYILRSDGTMTSHAQYDLPGGIGSGWLSVSGTYGSEDNDIVCRVDFDKAWVRRRSPSGTNDEDEKPYPTLESVPESMSKDVIQILGQLGFVKSVSVFPVSYLDEDTIVFDFEILGTRICARKVGPPKS